MAEYDPEYVSRAGAKWHANPVSCILRRTE